MGDGRVPTLGRGPEGRACQTGDACAAAAVSVFAEPTATGTATLRRYGSIISGAPLVAPSPQIRAAAAAASAAAMRRGDAVGSTWLETLYAAAAGEAGEAPTTAKAAHLVRGLRDAPGVHRATGLPRRTVARHCAPCGAADDINDSCRRRSILSGHHGGGRCTDGSAARRVRQLVARETPRRRSHAVLWWGSSPWTRTPLSWPTMRYSLRARTRQLWAREPHSHGIGEKISRCCASALVCVAKMKTCS